MQIHSWANTLAGPLVITTLFISSCAGGDSVEAEADKSRAYTVCRTSPRTHQSVRIPEYYRALRSGSSLSDQIVAPLPEGKAVTVHERSPDSRWVRIEYADQTYAWVLTRYLCP